MFRSLAAASAAIALSVTAATASPFGATVSSGGGEARSDNPGVLALFMHQVATILRFETGQGSDGVRTFEYFNESQCEESQIADSEAGEAQPAEKAEPTGPEPIYYGF